MIAVKPKAEALGYLEAKARGRLSSDGKGEKQIPAG